MMEGSLDMKKFVFLLAAIMILILPVVLLYGCGSGEEEKTVTIAEQYGLAYAPVNIMKQENLLEKRVDAEIRWKKMANTAAIREAMLAGEVDIGFVAIPPFLIGRDKGMDWKIISGLSRSPLGLMTNREDINSLSDFTEEDRIALPQPGSIQHILLAMAAEKEFGEPDRFDDRLVTMAHPDGMNALLSRQEITAHFTSPPYIFKESEEEDIHQVLSGEEALGGEFSFIVGVGTEEFHDSQPGLYRDFVEALGQAVDYINDNPGEAAGLLTRDYDLSREEIRKYITWPGMIYEREIRGLDKFAVFMREAGYIDFTAENSQLIWEEDFYVE
ncbi:MAG: ABC transporter substrate-binding protein [Halanaerobiaceae bacterium]